MFTFLKSVLLGGGHSVGEPLTSEDTPESGVSLWDQKVLNQFASSAAVWGHCQMALWRKKIMACSIIAVKLDAVRSLFYCHSS